MSDATAPGDTRTRDKKILVVDDDEDLRLALRIRMTAEGYTVVTAGDAASAVTVAHAERPDVILLDIGLPGGDGFSVVKRLRTFPELLGIPVIIVSAQDAGFVQPLADSLGVFGFIQKPPKNTELLAMVEQAL